MHVWTSFFSDAQEGIDLSKSSSNDQLISIVAFLIALNWWGNQCIALISHQLDVRVKCSGSMM